MPSSPSAYAKVIDSLVSESVTPKKQASLFKLGIRRRLSEDLVATNIQKTVEEAKLSTKDTNRKILYTLTKSSLRKGLSRSQTTKIKQYLGVSRKTLKKVSSIKGMNIVVKKKRCGISEAVQREVREFWLSPNVSRIVPISKRVKHGIPLHLLECSYTTAYTRYKSMNRTVQIGYVKFIQLKPKNVRHMREAERIVCCCVNVRVSK